MMDQTETVFQNLISKGWNFRNHEEIKNLIIQSKNSIETVESELLNMDLRSIGAKSLPDYSSLKKSSYISGPKILQLVSLRDICQSSIDASLKSVQRSHRLLKFVLTDGYSKVTAIEYTPMPSVSEEIIPGTKIRIENKVAVRSGILCLNPGSITIIGGYVPSLYEEWQMSQKYSGFSRSSLRPSQNENGAGPPPFEKLQLNTRPHQADQRQHSHDVFQPVSKDPVYKDESTQGGRNQGIHMVGKGSYSNSASVNRSDSYMKLEKTTNDKIEEKPSTSDSRPKEVSEAIPVQNQSAAQKLLQKMSQSNYGERNSRGRGHRFKGKQEESQVFTLEEWERRKGNNLKPITNDNDVSRDEELARQLQNQLDMEDFHEEPKYTEADQIRMSMFSFGEAEASSRSGQFRGRGRGRGGRGRGRGRGRGN